MKKDINLLQGFKAEKKHDLSKTRRGALTILLVVVILLGGAYAALKYGITYYEGLTNELAAEAATYSEVSTAKNAISLKKAEIADLEEVLKTISDTSYVNTDFLFSLSSVLNDNTFFTTLTINENGTLGINGKSATRDDIAYFMYSLKKTGLFSDVSVNMINTEQREDSGKPDTYDFTINAALKGGADGE